MTDENQAETEVEQTTEVESTEAVVETEVGEIDGGELTDGVVDEAEAQEDEGAETSEDEPEQQKREPLNSDDDPVVGELLSLIHGNLTNAFIEEIKNMPQAWEKTSEDGQDEIIERCRNRAEHHIRNIAAAIMGRNYERCTAIVDTVTHKDECKVVLKTHDVEGGLMFAQRAGGQSVVVVFTDDKEYLNGGAGMPKKDKKQPDLLEAAEEAGENSDDPLYGQAVDLVIAGGKVSIDLLQREIKIGYNRAARLIDAMESDGIISTADESGQRTVLEIDEPEAEPEAEEAETEEPQAGDIPMLYRQGQYDLIVDDSIETSIDGNDLEDAAAKLGYTEFEIQDQGTEAEYAVILDDERVRDDGVVLKIKFAETQPAAE